MSIAAVFGAVVPAQATIIKGPYSFDDKAFADHVRLIAGTHYATYPGGISLSDALIGDDLTSRATLDNPDTIVEVVFLDNGAFNGPGVDIVIFENGQGASEDMLVAVSGTTDGQNYSVYGLFTSWSLGFSEGGQYINGVSIDLSDAPFYLPANAEVDAVRITSYQNSTPDLSGVAALNSGPAPEPATIVLLGLGGLGILLRRRRARRA